MKLTYEQKINKYLKVEKHSIFAKTKVIIEINLKELNSSDEDNLIDVSDNEESTSEDLVGSISMPGILNMKFPEFNDELQLYFPFDVNLIIPESIDKNKDDITHYYEAGDRICFALTKSEATDILVLDKLFENRVIYLRGELYKQIVAIYDQLLSTENIMFHHIEVLLTVLYGVETEQGFELVRLTPEQKYSKINAIGTQKSAQKFNSAQGFSYGYTKDAIIENITRTNNPEKTDLEKVIGGHFDQLGI